METVGSETREIVASDSHVTKSALRGLLAGELAALWLKRFISAELSARLAEDYLSRHESWVTWEHREGGEAIYSDVQSVGLPLGTAVSTLSFPQYFDEADKESEHIAALCAPDVPPISKLQQELQSNGPYSIGVSKFLPQRSEDHYKDAAPFSGRQVKESIGRVMSHDDSRDHTEVLLHTDFKEGPPGRKLRGLLSANAYLRLPHSGGELEIWPATSMDIETVFVQAERKLGSTYEAWFEASEKLRKILPRPTIIDPAIGDVVILNTKFVHAVRPFSQGMRVTNQAFLEHTSDDSLMFRV